MSTTIGDWWFWFMLILLILIFIILLVLIGILYTVTIKLKQTIDYIVCIIRQIVSRVVNDVAYVENIVKKVVDEFDPHVHSNLIQNLS